MSWFVLCTHKKTKEQWESPLYETEAEAKRQVKLTKCSYVTRKVLKNV